MTPRGAIEIIPALLARDAHEFELQARAVEPLTSFAHIDIIDGSWLSGRTWADPFAVGELLSPLQYELHLMVANPLEHLAAWEQVPAVKRIIVHLEVVANPREMISAIRFHGWEAALALNPDTVLDAALAYEEYADEIMFMGVPPGNAGRAFDDRIINKLRTFCQSAPHAVVGVDGGINETTIPRLAGAGAQRLRVHSALFNSSRLPADAWLHLQAVAQRV